MLISLTHIRKANCLRCSADLARICQVRWGPTLEPQFMTMIGSKRKITEAWKNQKILFCPTIKSQMTKLWRSLSHLRKKTGKSRKIWSMRATCENRCKESRSLWRSAGLTSTHPCLPKWKNGKRHCNSSLDFLTPLKSQRLAKNSPGITSILTFTQTTENMRKSPTFAIWTQTRW